LPPDKQHKREDSEVNAIQYMFDTKLFTQTVENMFHGPKVAAVSRSVKKESRQAIVALTMQDWRELCQAYNVKKKVNYLVSQSADIVCFFSMLGTFRRFQAG
jgi:uncharacterized phage-associated protein